MLKMFLILLFLLLQISKPVEVKAAFLSFGPAKKTVKAGETFNIQVNIDTEGQETILGETLLTYDDNILEVIDVQKGNFYPSFAKNISGNKIYIGAYVNDIKRDTRLGKGSIATIKFKAFSEGEAKITFLCTPADLSDSNITSGGPDYEDIVDCNKLSYGSYLIVDKNSILPSISPAQLIKPSLAIPSNEITTILENNATPSPKKEIPTIKISITSFSAQATPSSNSLNLKQVIAAFIGITAILAFLTYLIIRFTVKLGKK